MLRIFLLLFIVVPIIEIALLLQVGGLIGGLNTLLLIVATAVIGAVLVKQQGIQNWLTMQKKLASGRPPAMEMVSGILIFLAGVMLITPGLMTDIIGLVLLFPASRKVIVAYLLKHLFVRGQAGFAQFQFRQRGNFRPEADTHQQSEGTVIDGEYSHQKKSTERLVQPDERGDAKDDENRR